MKFVTKTGTARQKIVTIGIAAGCLLSQTVPAQGLPSVSLHTVPAGQPLFRLAEGEAVPVTTRSGYRFLWAHTFLQESGKTLGPVKYRIALPKGRSLRSVKTLVLTIPPGGSSPIFAPSACAEFGMGAVALQGVTGERDDARLASYGMAVVRDLLAKNPDLKFVFAGFSMGGFGAQQLALSMPERCVGLVLVGNYFQAPPPTQELPIIMLVGRNDLHLSYAEKSLREQTDYGANIRLLTMPGGHGYGKPTDQDRALRALFTQNR